jgi:dTDP-4-dehydrorhamnose 3,5-epimerase
MNPLSGAYRVRLNQLADNRGVFVKTHMRSVFAAAGMCFDFLRGILLGFQKELHPRHALPSSAIRPRQDRVLPGWRGGGRVVGFAQRAPLWEFSSILLSEAQPELIVVPKGVAHGFRSLKDRSFMVSNASTEYAPQHDIGIRWDSFGFDWRCESPILSDRDQLNENFAASNRLCGRYFRPSALAASRSHLGAPPSDKSLCSDMTIHVAPICHAFAKIAPYGSRRSFCGACCRIARHARRECLHG